MIAGALVTAYGGFAECSSTISKWSGPAGNTGIYVYKYGHSEDIPRDRLADGKECCVCTDGKTRRIMRTAASAIKLFGLRDVSGGPVGEEAEGHLTWRRSRVLLLISDHRAPATDVGRFRHHCG